MHHVLATPILLAALASGCAQSTALERATEYVADAPGVVSFVGQSAEEIEQFARDRIAGHGWRVVEGAGSGRHGHADYDERTVTIHAGASDDPCQLASLLVHEAHHVYASEWTRRGKFRRQLRTPEWAVAYEIVADEAQIEAAAACGLTEAQAWHFVEAEAGHRLARLAEERGADADTVAELGELVRDVLAARVDSAYEVGQ